jgi:hypothetical protein
MIPTTRPHHRLRLLAVAGSTTAAMLAAAAPSSAAETTAKATGTTTVKLSTALTNAMKKGRVQLKGVSPAKRGDTAVKLPLTSATVDTEAGSGTLNHSGSLKFTRRGRSITLKAFRLAITPSASTITVTIGSSSVRAFNVDASAVKIKQTTKKVTLSDLKVTLTPIGASRLNRALKIQRFKSGMALGVGSASVNLTGGTGTGGATGSATVLTSGTSTLSLTPEAKAGLVAGGATLTTVAPATGSGSGPYAFPITGGALDGSKAFAGTTTLSGSLVLTAQGQSVTFVDPIVDLANAVVTAVVNGNRVELFSLDLSTIRNVAYEGQLVLDGIVVKRAKTGPLSDPEGKPSGVIGTLRIDARTK